MAQFHDEFGTLLQHPAWVSRHLLGQEPQRSVLAFVVWRPGGPVRQFGRDQDVIDLWDGAGIGSARHSSLIEHHRTLAAPKIKNLSEEKGISLQSLKLC
ncbi:hypothetical protein AV944_09950 [Sphingomonas sp. LK11]|nr:hypothetical protein AV944_09950 [Sphingomonas sp. LK11]